MKNENLKSTSQEDRIVYSIDVAAIQMFAEEHLNRRLPVADKPGVVRQQLIAWYKSKAMPLLERYCSEFAIKLGVTYPPLKLREMSKRWGSASSDGNLAFNWRIVMAPMRLVEYVAAHETCHLLIHDHSKAYWRTLGRLMPDFESRRVVLAIQGAKYQI